MYSRLGVRLGLWVLVSVCAATLHGCRPQVPASPLPPEEIAQLPPAGAQPWPRSFTDDLDAQVTLKSPPQRIVSIAPGLTEALFLLGAGDRVVGVTDFCDYPPQARTRERIGGITNASAEKIVSLQPDLVLVTRGVPLDLINKLREARLAVVGKDPHTVQDVIDDVRDLGQYLGMEQEAEHLAASLQGRMEAVVARGREVFGETTGPRVLMVIALEPVFVAGPGSLGDDVIRLCGASNVVRAQSGRQVSAWPQYSVEKIVEDNPDLIISALQSHEVEVGATLSRMRADPVWRTLDAVRQGRVYDIDADLLLRAGPRLLDGLEAVARMIQVPPGEDASV